MDTVSVSAGDFISIPISISKPSSKNMSLHLTPLTSNANFILESNPILLPANSSSAKIRIKYDGESVPEAINISMSLSSQFNLFYDLLPTTLYAIFDLDTSFQVDPPVMKIEFSSQHRNSSSVGFTVHHINNTNRES